MASNAPLEVVASQMEWIGRNFAHNLTFIPADKLDWKPAEKAESAYGITVHATGAIRHFHKLLAGVEEVEVKAPTSLEDAQQMLESAANAYAAWARTVPAEDLAKSIDTGFMGEMALGKLATIPAIDLIHHHGQIAYIQTLLGDSESHFVDTNL